MENEGKRQRIPKLAGWGARWKKSKGTEAGRKAKTDKAHVRRADKSQREREMYDNKRCRHDNVGGRYDNLG